jgi:hypothetical protein
MFQPYLAIFTQSFTFWNCCTALDLNIFPCYWPASENIHTKGGQIWTLQEENKAERRESFIFKHIVTCYVTGVRVRCLQVILTPTCRESGYPRQVIEVDASWTTTLYLAALPTVTTLITIIPLGTYNTSSWYIFLRDDATPLVHLSSLFTKLLWWTASLLDTVCTALTAFHYCLLGRAEQSRAEQKLTAGNQPARSLLAPVGPVAIYLLLEWQLRFSFSCGAPSLTRGRVWLLYMLLALASAIFLWSSFYIPGFTE